MKAPPLTCTNLTPEDTDDTTSPVVSSSTKSKSRRASRRHSRSSHHIYDVHTIASSTGSVSAASRHSSASSLSAAAAGASSPSRGMLLIVVALALLVVVLVVVVVTLASDVAALRATLASSVTTTATTTVMSATTMATPSSSSTTATRTSSNQDTGVTSTDAVTSSSSSSTSSPPSSPPPSPPSPSIFTGDFPNASTTGVPAGVTLTPYTGPSTITAANTVIDARHITVGLRIAAGAHNVTISRCLIEAQDYWLVLSDAGARNLTIVDCEMNGMNNAASDSAVAGSYYRLTRANIYGTGDGVKLGTGVVVEDSYIHDLVVTAESHNDGMQSLGSDDVLVRHNTVILADGATSALLLSTGSASSMRRITIDNNLFGGGGYCVYAGYEAGRDDLSKVGDIVVSGNHFTTSVYARGGSFGPITSADAPAVTVVNNVWHDGPKKGQDINS